MTEWTGVSRRGLPPIPARCLILPTMAVNWDRWMYPSCAQVPGTGTRFRYRRVLAWSGPSAETGASPLSRLPVAWRMFHVLGLPGAPGLSLRPVFASIFRMKSLSAHGMPDWVLFRMAARSASASASQITEVQSIAPIYSVQFAISRTIRLSTFPT